MKDPSLTDDALKAFTFTVTDDHGHDHDLIENGSDIPLTLANREMYGQLVARYLLGDSLADEIRAFTEGFQDVIPAEVVSVFDIDELTLIMGGTPYIDLEDWRENTEYGGEFGPRHTVVIWFWEVLEKLSQDQLRKFLLFCTGMPRVPIDGFK